LEAFIVDTGVHGFVHRPKRPIQPTDQERSRRDSEPDTPDLGECLQARATLPAWAERHEARMNAEDALSANGPAVTGYQAFLVRCWQWPAGGGRPAVWHFVVREISAEAQEYRFTDWLEVTAFIADRMQQSE
jgi:hypothetical protein